MDDKQPKIVRHHKHPERHSTWKVVGRWLVEALIVGLACGLCATAIILYLGL